MVSGGGDLVATGYKGGVGAAVITGGGDLTAVGYKGGVGVALVTGGGDLTATGHKGAVGHPVITGGGGLVAGGWKEAVGSSDISGGEAVPNVQLSLGRLLRAHLEIGEPAATGVGFSPLTHDLAFGLPELEAA